MKSWKPLLPFGETTLIETVVQTAIQVCRRVILVAGYRGGELAELFDDNPRVVVVRNTEWEEGMLSSIQAGVRRIESKKFFIVPGDMPYLTEEVYRALCDAPPAAAVAPLYDGRRGHPVLVDSGLIARITTAGPEVVSMREILAEEKFETIGWKDNSILRDIDTPEDYHKNRLG